MSKYSKHNNSYKKQNLFDLKKKINQYPSTNFMDDYINPYEILNIPISSTPGQCKLAYMKLATNPNRNIRRKACLAYDALCNKEKYIQNMQELCHKLGMRFYVSDAHFKECSDNCCCCALPPNWDYSRGHFAAALQIAKKTGQVKWSDIERDMYFLDFPYVRAEGFNVNSSENRAKFDGLTMKDYLRYLWNTPKRGQGPYKIFEKVLEPDGLDENGDIIYKYNSDVTFEPSLGLDRNEVIAERV